MFTPWMARFSSTESNFEATHRIQQVDSKINQSVTVVLASLELMTYSLWYTYLFHFLDKRHFDIHDTKK